MVTVTENPGYLGSAIVDGVQVLVTSAAFQTDITPSYLNMLSMPVSTASRTKVLHADGTAVASANIAFDVTSSSLVLLSASRLIQRGDSFSLGIHDGKRGQNLTNCMMQSLTIAGSAGGLITCNLQALSSSAPVVGSVTNAFIRDQEPYGYWYSGNANVREWTLSISQALNPVYTNENETYPRYLRYGLLEISLDVTTYEQLQAYEEIYIATGLYTLLRGATTSQGYNYGGQTELGYYTHRFDASARASIGSSDAVIQIT